MTIKPSPKLVQCAVHESVCRAANDAVGWDLDLAVNVNVNWDVCRAVEEAVSEAVRWAMYSSVIHTHPHPNIDRFLIEVHRARARWGAPWASS